MRNRKPSYKKQIAVKIKDYDWNVFLYIDSSYEKKHGEDSDAITLKDKRQIDFKAGSLSLEAIRHEIMHALVDSCNLSSSSLETEQMEELCCSIVENDIYTILQLSEKIHKELM